MNFYKLDFTIPSSVPMLTQLSENPGLWNQNNLRTTFSGSSHYQASDIWLRYNDLNTPYLQSELFNGKDMISYPAFQVLTSIHKTLSLLLFLVEGERLGRVIVTKLPPYSEIVPHRDDGGTALYYDRFHIVLKEGGSFSVGDESVRMKDNEIWWFDNQKVHSVLNDSDGERIHLIVDIKLMECSPFWKFKKHTYSEEP